MTSKYDVLLINLLCQTPTAPSPLCQPIFTLHDFTLIYLFIITFVLDSNLIFTFSNNNLSIRDFRLTF